MPNQETRPGTHYLMDARFEVKCEDSRQSVKGRGIVAAPHCGEYDVWAKSPGKMDRMSLISCAREIRHEKVGSSESVPFTPDKEDEGVGKYCPLRLMGLEQKKERHAFGFVLFKHPKYQARVTVICNGKIRTFNGVGHCQVRQGLPATIIFPSFAIAESTCKTGLVEGKKIKFNVPLGECVHYFKMGNSQKFRFVTYGYEEILYRSL